MTGTPISSQRYRYCTDPTGMAAVLRTDDITQAQSSAQQDSLLADLRTRLGLSYIFITHDLPIVRHFADRILVMKQGEIVEEGTTSAIFSNPSHAYTRSLLDATPAPKWQSAHRLSLSGTDFKSGPRVPSLPRHLVVAQRVSCSANRADDVVRLAEAYAFSESADMDVHSAFVDGSIVTPQGRPEL